MNLLERLDAAVTHAAETAERLGLKIERLQDGRELISGGAAALRSYRRSIAFAAAAAVLREELRTCESKEERNG